MGSHDKFNNQSYEHVPVLLDEVVRILDPRPGRNYVDATLGGGGYVAALLGKNQPGGRILAIDLDAEALEHFQLKTAAVHPGENEAAVTLVHGNFSQIDSYVARSGIGPVSGIVADLGLSSYQLDQSRRGISFQADEPLDMRFDRSGQAMDAKTVLSQYQQPELERVLRDYGEEPFSGAIAAAVVRRREKSPIGSTAELFSLISDALPKPRRHKAADHARRVFQALRIEVNRELDSLQEFLPKAFDLLVPGGRLAIVSFHSLEDRMVKRYFSGLAKGCVCPPEFPQCLCGRSPRAKIITKKPIQAGEEELQANRRSRPAKLRAVEKYK